MLGSAKQLLVLQGLLSFLVVLSVSVLTLVCRYICRLHAEYSFQRTSESIYAGYASAMQLSIWHGDAANQNWLMGCGHEQHNGHLCKSLYIC